MDKKAITWMLFFISMLIFWFYQNIPLEIDYDRHPQLVDKETGAKRKPSDLLELGKIINLTSGYIDATSAQERLYDLVYHSNFENPFLLSHSYSSRRDLAISGWPVANQTLCANQLEWILSLLNSNKNYTQLKGRLGYELTNLMDSFGRPESGTYNGIINWFGSYKQCLKVNLNRDSIKTRYCIGRMRFKWWPKNETAYPITSINLGLCLPETCDSLSFEKYQLIIEQLAKFELPEFYKDNLELHSLFCLPDERSPIRALPASGHLYIIIVSIWLFLVIGASILYELLFRVKRQAIDKTHHCLQDKQELGTTSIYYSTSNFAQKILMSLSIRTSLKLFKENRFKIKYNQGNRVKVNLSGLDFFKVAMAILVVLGHSCYLSSIYSRSLTNRISMNTSNISWVALSTGRCVDTFFFFFGLLTSYTLMRKFNLKQLSNPFNWILVNFGIFMRITPTFMLIYWYSKSVSTYTGSGPWWDYGVDKFSMKGVCMRDPWWKSIPYFGSIGMPAVPTCNLPSWFIVSYSHISLIAPLIVYILCKLPNNTLRFIFTAFLSLISSLSVGLRLYMQSSVKAEAFTLYGGFILDLLEKFESTGHITTFGRIGSVSAGILVGYLLRKYEIGEIEDWPNWLKSRKTALLLIFSHILMILAPLLGHYAAIYIAKQPSLGELATSNAILTNLWNMLNALLCINVTTANNHLVISRFFSHSFWHSFNRLGFTIFMVHWEILFIGATHHEQAPTYGFIQDVFKLWSYGICLSIGIAFAIYILVEAPLAQLLSLLMSNSIEKLDREKDHECKVIKQQANGIIPSS